MRDNVPQSLHLPRLMDYGWQCQPLLTPSPSRPGGTGLEFKPREQDEEVKELWKVFQAFDGNGDGLICKRDMTQMMARMEGFVSELDVLATIEAVDEDGDGFVDFGEFCSIFHGEAPAPRKDLGEEEDDDLVEAFRVFDENKDGFISVEELQSVLCKLGFIESSSLKCSNMIRMVDSNGDGRVDFQEFKQMMCKPIVAH